MSSFFSSSSVLVAEQKLWESTEWRKVFVTLTTSLKQELKGEGQEMNISVESLLLRRGGTQKNAAAHQKLGVGPPTSARLLTAVLMVW